MAIKAGQILHDVNGFVVDRIQTGGVSNLNIPEERIYELGNYETVATVLDIPELTFDMESLDVSTEVESLLLAKNPTAAVDGDEFNLMNQVPIDVISPFKSAQGQYDVVKGIVIPSLHLESCTYRFGVRQNSTQSFQFRGDSVYYTPGTPYYEEFTITAGTNQVYTLAHTANTYTESGDTIYALGVCAVNPSTYAYKRLFINTDFTNTSTTVTTLANLSTEGYTKLRVCYSSNTAATYSQDGNNPNSHVIHEGDSVKPAAVRGKDIDVYVASAAATETFTRWTGVQSFEVTRRINLENDEEFGNYKYVSQSFDTQEVTGSIVVKSVDADDLWDKIASVANVANTVVAGPFTRTPIPVELRISDPSTGSLLKTIYIPDAKFTLPAVQGRVQQKLEVTFNFSSDTGQFYIYKGARP